jgi:restriction system protein
MTDKGNRLGLVDPDAVRRFVVEQNKRNRDQVLDVPDYPEDPFPVDLPSEDENLWRDTLLDILRNMDPAGFERLCQRLLRESGFIDVEVTGRSGDGGIDGRGIIRFAGLIGFPVLFQCKRYSNSVTPSQIRDFRGAMTGRADRGLVITTGGFTREAQAEATRDGAPPIDLIDGNMLIDKLKELELGVTTKLVEVVEVDGDWFSNI